MTRFLRNMAMALLIALPPGGTQALEAVRPLEGYKCFRVYVPEEKRFDPLASPPVFAAPTEASRQIGREGSISLVKWPINEVEGFVEIIWGERGVKAWIHKDVLRPWRDKFTPPGPGHDCVPSVMSDGGIGTSNGLHYPRK